VTAPEARPGAPEPYEERIRALPPHERIRIAVALSMAVRELAEAGIRLRHPNADDAEVRVRLAVRLYGREAVSRVLGPLPDDAF
jgi:hypothetical protein